MEIVRAVEEKNLDKVKELLDKGEDPDSADQNDVTILMDAASLNDYNMVKLLLDHGANPNLYGLERQTPLMFAINSDISILQLLIERGANINYTDIYGNSALMYLNANTNKKKVLEKIKLFVSKGANLNIQNIYGSNILFFYYDPESEEYLLKNGADPNVLDKSGNSPLIGAVKDRDLNRIKLLLDYGADINVIPNSKISALHEAVSNNDLEIADYLLAKGIRTDVQDMNSNTPLYISVTKIYDDMTNLLLNNGADPNIYHLDSPLASSNYNGNMAISELLLQFGADPFDKNAFQMCGDDWCQSLMSKYMWKRLYDRDKNEAKKYSEKTQIPKDVWELILLNKRQQQLCQDLSSDQHYWILFYFAQEYGIPVGDKTKAELCATISRQLVYGKKYEGQSEKELITARKNIKKIAFKFGLDPNKSVQELLNELSWLLQEQEEN